MKAISLLAPSLLAILLVACSGGDDTTTGGSSVPPGDEDFTPPPTDNGGGRPSGATNVTCQSGSDCAYWFCRCDDGSVVNSADCSNGFCMDAPSACPGACEYFNHGGWTGEAGGGPVPPQPDPGPGPSAQCGNQGSTDSVCWSCVESQCCSESAACYDNAECLGYWDCVADCGIGAPGCESQCGSIYPGGENDYYQLESCLVSDCSLECAG